MKVTEYNSKHVEFREEDNDDFVDFEWVKKDGKKKLEIFCVHQSELCEAEAEFHLSKKEAKVLLAVLLEELT